MSQALSAQLRPLLANAELPPSRSRRALGMKLGQANEAGQDLLLQRADINECVNGGISGRLACLSHSAHLPLKSFMGQPVEVQIVTDRGELRRICAISTGARVGQSDGSLTLYELDVEDALGLMARRINSRIFRKKNDPAIIQLLLAEWRQRSPALAASFDFVVHGLNTERYPERELTHQVNESDAAFVKRLLKRSGISWFFRPGQDGDTPIHEMVLFDQAWALDANPASPIRYHRDDATEQRDAITRITRMRDLVVGAVERSTWNYKSNRIDQARDTGAVNQGDVGDQLAAFLLDSQIEMPHSADNWTDLGRRTSLRMAQHDLHAKCLHGESGVRDLCPGQYIRIEGHPEIDTHPEAEQEFIVLEVHHRAENNLPKEVGTRAHLLTGGDQDDPPFDEKKRYRNTFRAVRRDVQVVPDWDPKRDLPAVHPMTALVVGPGGEEVHTDELGRVKVQFQSYKAEDHQHAQGAGASGTDSDSAWLRYVSALAGDRFGANFIPRVGMEVYIEFLGGDPDKPIIVGVVHNGVNTPAAWSDAGALPGNRYVSGIKTKEIHGTGYNQLRYDDTPGQISIQWSTSYAATQLNAGWLTHPRTDGKGRPRGQGLEARSDAQVALRGGQGVYITAQAQTNAGGDMLERRALLGLAEQLQGIVQQFGETSSLHKAEGTDSALLERIVTQLKHWDGGTNVNEGGADGGAPMVAIDGPAGIAVGSQDALVLGAQSHIDMVSAGNSQLSAGKRMLLRAADMLSAFAGKGMKLITAEGKLQIEAHKDNIEVAGPKQIVISAGEEIILQAPRIRFIAQGTQVDHGQGRIVEQSQSLHRIMSPEFSIGGAGGGHPNVAVPSSQMQADERFVLRLRNTGAPIKQRAYRITLDDGQVIAGRTDDKGQTDLAQRDAMRLTNIEFPEDDRS